MQRRYKDLGNIHKTFRKWHIQIWKEVTKGERKTVDETFRFVVRYNRRHGREGEIRRL